MHLEKAIEIHESLITKARKSQVNIASANSNIPADLEKSEVMKMLAEELIKVGRITDGIDVARRAMDTQLNFFHGMKNSNI
jgi:hypothetical protein